MDLIKVQTLYRKSKKRLATSIFLFVIDFFLMALVQFIWPGVWVGMTPEDMQASERLGKVLTVVSPILSVSAVVLLTVILVSAVTVFYLRFKYRSGFISTK